MYSIAFIRTSDNHSLIHDIYSSFFLKTQAHGTFFLTAVTEGSRQVSGQITVNLFERTTRALEHGDRATIFRQLCTPQAKILIKYCRVRKDVVYTGICKKKGFIP
jgi:hypothetical protein